MQVIHAKTALLPEGWASDVTVTINGGRIASLTPTLANLSVDLLLPAPGNVHSHAFQRAMAGLTEARGPCETDSFWTWRALMFRFLDHLGPEDVRAIAAQVQMEMLEAGYAAVGEFHYLHHQPGGTPYADIAELCARICEAAEQTGIGLTLLPVLYQTGGVDGRALAPGQVRFGNTTDQFAALLQGAAQALDALPDDARLGVAPHSLRAVPADALRQVPDMTDGPLHMHLAEQVPEVTEIEASYGARPVEWSLAELPLDARWCLIHCTQMTPAETEALARTGAVAGLCPITEASLGDGIFDGARWLGAGGHMAVGSDSNIDITLSGELRQLEYSQRLKDRARAVLADRSRSTGRRLFEAAAAGSAQALDRDAGQIAPGRIADLVALDGTSVDLIGRYGDAILDTWMVTSGDALVREVWSAGRHVVQDGRHVQRESIEAAFRASMTRLAGVL